MSSPTVVFFRPNNPIAALNEKEAGFTRARAVFLRTRGGHPRTLFACTYVETNLVALLPPLVRHQSFELRHDSIGGKVTIGYHRLRKAPTTIAREFGRLLSNGRVRNAHSRSPRFVSSRLIETRASPPRQLSSRSWNRDESR